MRVVTVPHGWVTAAGGPVVVGAGSDGEEPKDGLDPELVTPLIDEHHDRRWVGPSSWAKSGLAA